MSPLQAEAWGEVALGSSTRWPPVRGTALLSRVARCPLRTPPALSRPRSDAPVLPRLRSCFSSFRPPGAFLGRLSRLMLTLVIGQARQASDGEAASQGFVTRKS